MKQKELYPSHAANVLFDWIEKEFDSQAGAVWKATISQYHQFVRTAPDYGGKKSPHVNQIHGSFLLLAFCSVSPKNYTIEELEPLSFEMFMSPFHILGKLFSANHKWTMDLLSIVFRKATEKSNAHAKNYPADFTAEIQPYDKENGIVRYCFTRCPIADFVKEHHLDKWMPLMCNCDHTALNMIHAGLIREHTCHTGNTCDYCVASEENPLMKQYELIRNQDGLLVSRRKNGGTA